MTGHAAGCSGCPLRLQAGVHLLSIALIDCERIETLVGQLITLERISGLIQTAGRRSPGRWTYQTRLLSPLADLPSADDDETRRGCIRASNRKILARRSLRTLCQIPTRGQGLGRRSYHPAKACGVAAVNACTDESVCITAHAMP